jgi:hypothetical protein
MILVEISGLIKKKLLISACLTIGQLTTKLQRSCKSNKDALFVTVIKA